RRGQRPNAGRSTSSSPGAAGMVLARRDPWYSQIVSPTLAVLVSAALALGPAPTRLPDRFSELEAHVQELAGQTRYRELAEAGAGAAGARGRGRRARRPGAAGTAPRPRRRRRPAAGAAGAPGAPGGRARAAGGAGGGSAARAPAAAAGGPSGGVADLPPRCTG